MTEPRRDQEAVSSAGPRRLAALDGLRGLASVVVLLHHIALLHPAVAAIYLFGAPPPAPGSALWVLTGTPLQLLVSGQEAVLVFFVLSGLVVALPALRAGFDWFAYLPRRLVRLVLPVAGSVGLATLIVLVTRPDASRASSAWVAASIGSPDPRTVLLDLDLLYGAFVLNNPLWSLRWELVFSILLGAYVVVGLLARGRRGLILTAAGAAAVMAVGRGLDHEPLYYLAVFLLGTVLAVRLDDVRRLTELRPGRSGTALWWLALVVALLALCSRWIIWPWFPGAITSSSAAGDVAGVVAAFGAAMVVLIAAAWPGAARVLEWRPVRWLGRVSFSLYLVHVPILVGVGAVVGAVAGPERWWLTAVIAAPVALGVAELFTRFVEMPSHRLSKRVGAAAARRWERAAAGR